MKPVDTREASVEDCCVPLPSGRVFVRRWRAPTTKVDASPIVLLHDSLGCVELWRDFPQQLAQATQREVMAYDRRGFGQSEARGDLPPLDFVAHEAAHDFAALRQALGLQSFVALGHSVGGGMAIECAAQHGAACQALITLAAQVRAEDRTLQGIRAAQRQFADAQQVQRLARYHGDKAPWVLRAWIERWLDPDFAAWTLEPTLQRVHCPVLAIHGADDEYGSRWHPERIGALVRGPVQVQVWPGIGHVPQREDAPRVLQTIGAWLSDLP